MGQMEIGQEKYQLGCISYSKYSLKIVYSCQYCSADSTLSFLLYVSYWNIYFFNLNK